jgi:Tubulin like
VHKFILVGCGGSGGTTLRFLIDQLRADFRARGWDHLPKAWQFVHVDVPVPPDSGPAPLLDIRQMGGTYVSLTSSTNSYKATSLNVEARLLQNGGDLSPLLGWEPRNRESANSIPVTNGAGQYRSVGRMLTLARLEQIQEAFIQAQARIVAPDSWDGVPDVSEHGGDVIMPIVIGSMAGGSGASMFLDVCRILGQLPGVQPQNLGVFLYTADVFGQLPSDARKNVEGNAMAAIPEIFAAISRLGEADDLKTLRALGLTVNANEQGHPAFGRILPIGRRIGGAGAFFGDGSQEGVYRGVARALAGVMTSAVASARYRDYFIGNPQPKTASSERFGWRISGRELPFGSMGFASLSLGRDRYVDYAAQRLSRAAIDHLMEGHRQPGSHLPDVDQLRLILDNQWRTSLRNIGLPLPEESVSDWFKSVAFPQVRWESMSAEGSAPVMNVIRNTGSAQASAWVGTVTQAIGSVRQHVQDNLRNSAYLWAESWALQLEDAIKAEFLNVVSTFGLAYARELMTRIRQRCDQMIGPMSDAGMKAEQIDPVAVDAGLMQQALALGRQTVGADHVLGQAFRKGIQAATEERLRREAVKLGANVLRSWTTDVLAALEREANDSMAAIEHARVQTSGGAGLAQLHSHLYVEWPDESDAVPTRFNHAQNEVLLTTAEQFPARFRADVAASGSGRTYGEGMAVLRSQALSGVWETTGARVEHPVLTQSVQWRPNCLPRGGADGLPTPESKPRYDIRLTPVDLINRAREMLSTPGSVFAEFASQSINGYLIDPQVSAVDRSRRQEEFVGKFVDTLAMARPVVGVDPAMAQRLHNLSELQYAYSFSEIPFQDSDPIAQAIIQRLGGMSDVTHETLDAFKGALKGDTGNAGLAGKISVFGAYEKVSPLCFSSLLDPIKKSWNGATPAERRELWGWKRTRPLPAALGMAPEEALLATTGWYLGRLTGLVRQGDDPQNPQASVCGSMGWLNFGPFLDSMDTSLKSAHDVLPAVLMAHAWALVRCSGDPELTPLAPYEALRHLVDDSGSNVGVPGLEALVGTRLLNAAFFGRPLQIGNATLQGDRPSAVLLGDQAGALPRPSTAPVVAGAYGQLATATGYPAATPFSGINPTTQYGYAGAQPTTPIYGGINSASLGSPLGTAVQPVGPDEARARHDRVIGWVDRALANISASGMLRDGRSFVKDVPTLQVATLYQECAPLVAQGLSLLRQLADAAISLGDTASLTPNLDIDHDYV